MSLRFWGAGLLVLSAAAFVSPQCRRASSALTALPLLALWVYWLIRYVASTARAARARPGRPWPVILAVIALGLTLVYQAVSLAPAFRSASMDWREMVAVMEFLTMAALALLTWEGFELGPLGDRASDREPVDPLRAGADRDRCDGPGSRPPSPLPCSRSTS